MKKLLAASVANTLALSLNACSKNPAGPAAPNVGKPMKGQIVTAWRFVKNLDRDFNRPYGLALNPGSRPHLYVAETATHTVWDNYPVTWWVKSISDSQNRLTSPAGIAVSTSDSTLYVADGSSHSVQRYRESWQGVWGKLNLFGDTIAGTEAGAFNNPAGVAWDAPYVFICDKGNNRIQKIDTRNHMATVIERIFSRGTTAFTFNAPTGIAVDASHNVYVTDANGVKKFKGFQLLAKWDGTNGAGKFIRPSGIAVSPSGWEVYVTDNGNNRVQVFDNSGNYVNSFGSAGSGNGQFGLATYAGGIVVQANSFDLSQDLVYVADPGNKRVQLWQRYLYVPGGTDYRQ